MKRVFLITGASGELGKSFVKNIDSKEIVYKFSRSELSDNSDNKCFILDLLEEEKVKEVLELTDLDSFNEIVLIHTVGKFKFENDESKIEDKDGDGIDDEIYKTNVITTKNILKYVKQNINGRAEIKVCVFASVSDKYSIPYWSSYTRAKNILRGYLQTLSENQIVSALVVNVSTVDTGNENLLRPNADKTYWLKPEEIVTRVLPELNDLDGYTEIDIIKEHPDFKKDYYINHESILEKWHSEMREVE